jgi:hypothetical protein
MRLQQQFSEDFIWCMEDALNELRAAVEKPDIDSQRVALRTLVGLVELLKSEIAKQVDDDVVDCT